MHLPTTFRACLVVAILAGCQAPADVPPPSTSSAPPPAVPSASSSPADTATGESDLLKVAGCAPLPADYQEWFNESYEFSWQAVSYTRLVDPKAIGATVTSPSGDWTVFARRITDYGQQGQFSAAVFITPAPPTPDSELIAVAGISASSGYLVWLFNDNTNWRDEQQELGKQAALLALECVGAEHR